jgi:hypothetical protein
MATERLFNHRLLRLMRYSVVYCEANRTAVLRRDSVGSATAYCIAKRTRCSTNLQRLVSTALANVIWNHSNRFRCSSLTTSSPQPRNTSASTQVNHC